MKTYSLLRTKEKTDLSALMAWKPETVAKLALDLLRENALLQEAIEQLQADLRDAMKMAREGNR